jgi:hypothetical protein
MSTTIEEHKKIKKIAKTFSSRTGAVPAHLPFKKASSGEKVSRR